MAKVEIRSQNNGGSDDVDHTVLNRQLPYSTGKEPVMLGIARDDGSFLHMLVEPNPQNDVSFNVFTADSSTNEHTPGAIKMRDSYFMYRGVVGASTPIILGEDQSLSVHVVHPEGVLDERLVFSPEELTSAAD